MKRVWRSGRVADCSPVGRRFAPRTLLLKLSCSVELVRHLWKMSEKFDIYSKIFFRDVENFGRHLCVLVLRHQMRVSNYFVNSFYSVSALIMAQSKNFFTKPQYLSLTYYKIVKSSKSEPKTFSRLCTFKALLLSEGFLQCPKQGSESNPGPWNVCTWKKC